MFIIFLFITGFINILLSLYFEREARQGRVRAQPSEWFVRMMLYGLFGWSQIFILLFYAPILLVKFLTLAKNPWLKKIQSQSV